jgi:hypothetical protein
MKAKFVSAICVLAFTMATATPVVASEDDPTAVAADILVVRPICLVATGVGSVVFVLGLPFAALSKSVKKSAHTLVVKPAQATFTRPLGDMDSLMGEYP